MIDFIFKFKELSLSWQVKKSQSYSLRQIAERTQTGLPYVIKYISDSLGEEIEYTQLITFSEAKIILETLTKKYRRQIDAQYEIKKAKAEKLKAAYDLVIKKTNKLQLVKDWDSAFKSLSYFTGEHGHNFHREIFVNLCSNIVRSGIKAKNTNLQEISLWLRKGVEKNLLEGTEEALSDALDLVETYSDYFQKEISGKGKAVLIEILNLLEPSAYELQALDSYKNCVDKIFLSKEKEPAQKKTYNEAQEGRPTAWARR